MELSVELFVAEPVLWVDVWVDVDDVDKDAELVVDTTVVVVVEELELGGQFETQLPNKGKQLNTAGTELVLWAKAGKTVLPNKAAPIINDIAA